MNVQKIVSVVVVIGISFSGVAFAADNGAVNILRAGLLGAGTGAISGAVSGGDSDKLWISALTGAGVNIVGGSLLDLMTQDGGSGTGYREVQTTPRYHRRNTQQVRRPQAEQTTTYYVAQQTPVVYTEFSADYKEGYKDGYLQGYREAVKEFTGTK